MDTPTAILLITSATTIVITLVLSSYKTGFIAYSIQSSTRKSQPEFEVDKSKIGSFVAIIAAIFAANIVFCLVVLRDTQAIGSILALSQFNTAILAYGLAYWTLFKPKS